MSNQMGQGIVAAMVGAAITLIVMTSSLEFLKISFKGNRLVSSKADLNSTWNLVELILQSQNLCTAGLKQGGSLPSFDGVEESVELTSFDFKELPILTPGNHFGDFQIKKIILTKEEESSPNHYIATLRVVLIKTGSGLGSATLKEFPLALKTDGGIPNETVTSCSSVGFGATRGASEDVADCGVGWTKYGKGYNVFCIQNTEEDPKKFYKAVQDCHDRGFRLCSDSEWGMACRSGMTLSGKGNWVDQTRRLVLFGSLYSTTRKKCNAHDIKLTSTKGKYRCCKDL